MLEQDPDPGVVVGVVEGVVVDPDNSSCVQAPEEMLTFVGPQEPPVLLALTECVPTARVLVIVPRAPQAGVPLEK